MPVDPKRMRERELEMEAEQEAEEEEEAKEKGEAGEEDPEESPLRKARTLLSDEPVKTRKVAKAVQQEEDMAVGTITMEDLADMLATSVQAGIQKGLAPLIEESRAQTEKIGRLTKALSLFGDQVEEIAGQNHKMLKGATIAAKPAGAKPPVASAPTTRRAAADVDIIQKGVAGGESGEPTPDTDAATKDQQEIWIDKAIALQRSGTVIEDLSAITSAWENDALSDARFREFQQAVKAAS